MIGSQVGVTRPVISQYTATIGDFTRNSHYEGEVWNQSFENFVLY